MLRAIKQESALLREAHKALGAQLNQTGLNAFTHVPPSQSVLEQVKNAELSKKEGPLVGKLIAVKDNICTTSLPTTAASKLLKPFTSPYDATIIEKLHSAGAIVAGKTNLDEFGMGSHSIHSPFGAISQLSALGNVLSAGGSSGGSAVAVATGQCHAAIGTDTGGSVRLPAAYNNIVGFKPSYGLISRWGVIAYANSLDTVGLFGKSVEDVRVLFELFDSFDSKDPTSLPESSRSRLDPDRRFKKATGLRSLRVGIPVDYNILELDSSIRKSWQKTALDLQLRGAKLVPISLPTTQHALSAYYVLAPAEASSNLAKYDGVRYGARAAQPDGTVESVLFAKTRGEGLGEEVQRRVLLGAYTLSAEAKENYFIQAQKVRRLVQEDFNQVFKKPNPLTNDESGTEGVDVLLCPTAPTPPPSHRQIMEQQPVDAYINDVFTVPASLAGLPAVSAPVGSGTSHGQGMQIIGQFGDDALVLDVAESIEAFEQSDNE